MKVKSIWVRETTDEEINHALMLSLVNVNAGHGNVNSGSVHVNAGTQVKSGISRFNTGKQHVNSGSVYVNAGTQVKSAASRDHPLKHMEHRGIFDSGCSGHMTAQMELLESMNRHNRGCLAILADNTYHHFWARSSQYCLLIPSTGIATYDDSLPEASHLHTPLSKEVFSDDNEDVMPGNKDYNDKLVKFEQEKLTEALELLEAGLKLSGKNLNKKDERGVVVRNKARLVAQGHRQEEGIALDEVFAPVAELKHIRVFLAFASFMGFIVYQMDVKSAFLYGTINEEVYVSQPPGFFDPDHPTKVYKVVFKALYGFDTSILELDQEICSLMSKLAITPMETKLPLTKDEEAFDVDVHLYRSMIGSLMYLTASRPDIMYAVCVCSRCKVVTPKTSHLNAVKEDLHSTSQANPTWDLWYPRDSPFDLGAFSE
ncbi:putative ribonuclease H-like domain-containing protein [Tanacetum coccineum]|uniref:Ribonuclease H-like domain-containing protein n=1 Tax=Tanacetum coccineum TaxID=301880 RepID=A0ABQ5B7I3_9ASTR